MEKTSPAAGVRAVIVFAGQIWREHPYRLILIVVLMSVVSLTQGMAIALLVPVLSLLTASNGVALDGTLMRILQGAMGRIGLDLTLGSLLFFIATLALCEAALKLFQQTYTRRFMGHVVTVLQIRLYEAYLAASWPFWLQKHTGQLVSSLTSEAIRVLTALDQLNHFLSNAILVIVFLGLALSMSFSFTLVFLLAGVFLFVIMRRNVGSTQAAGADLGTQNRSVHQIIHEQLGAAKLIKSSGMERASSTIFGAAVSELNDTEIRTNTIRFRADSALSAFVVILLCLGLYYALAILQIEAARAFVIMFMFFRLAAPLAALQQTSHLLLLHAPGYMNMLGDLKEAESFREKRQGSAKPFLNQMIELSNVEYRYRSGRSILQLDRVTVPANRTVGVVGESGSGKSTLLDLVVGLIEPDAGTVVVDGVDLRNVDLGFWRSQIGYVGQETFLFDDTIANNIRWGSSETSNAAVEQAARLANANDFINQLPERYETVIGNRGIRLSGGERQRIALARALIRRPKLLILDEATSSLDSVSEKAVQEAIDGLKSTMTILIVAHRLSTIQNSDWIYVIDRGRRVQDGPWEQLVAEAGPFQELWSMQSGGVVQTP